MTELKTLKGLEEKGLLNGYTHGEFSLVHVPKLKAEAIKWVKEAKEKFGNHEDVVYFIKHFFNLTEEDLK